MILIKNSTSISTLEWTHLYIDSLIIAQYLWNVWHTLFCILFTCYCIVQIYGILSFLLSFFSAILANCFSSATCFCVSIFVVLLIYWVPFLVLVYSGFGWLSGNIESIWLLLQFEGKEYCRSVWLPWLDETRFNRVFDECVRFF